MTYSFTNLSEEVQSFEKDIIEGFTFQPKQINPMYLYNKKGSMLFEKICQLDEYYITRTELYILNKFAQQIEDSLPDDSSIIEFGSGSDKKISAILNTTEKVTSYIPIDVSKEFLVSSSTRINHNWPALDVHAICADYTKLSYNQLTSIASIKNSVVFFPGSTIGNLTTNQVEKLLVNIREIIGKSGQMILGIDLAKSEKILLKAYNDSKNITAQFNLNLIDRIANELKANITKSDFKYLATYNKTEHRIEMYLQALNDMKFKIANKLIELKQGDKIHTESSHKYNLIQFGDLLKKVSMRIKHTFTDDNKYFAVLIIQAI